MVKIFIEKKPPSSLLPFFLVDEDEDQDEDETDARSSTDGPGRRARDRDGGIEAWCGTFSRAFSWERRGEGRPRLMGRVWGATD